MSHLGTYIFGIILRAEQPTALFSLSVTKQHSHSVILDADVLFCSFYIKSIRIDIAIYP